MHRYDDPRDREIAGLIASVFAYGNVKIVLRTVAQALRISGRSPQPQSQNSIPSAIYAVFDLRPRPSDPEEDVSAGKFPLLENV